MKTKLGHPMLPQANNDELARQNFKFEKIYV